MASMADANVERRERLRKLALELIDITKDPYIIKNHLGKEIYFIFKVHTNADCV
jgi:splicing factor 3A subunit 2